MRVIYEPKGRAREYSPLAANLYTGCVHGCKYCYVPSTLRKTSTEFHQDVKPRKDILKKLEKDCQEMEGDPRQILLCFTCDPYQPADWVCPPHPTTLPSNEAIDPNEIYAYRVPSITREALLIFEKYHMNVTVLTKGGTRASRDFDILKRNGWWFGTTLSFATNPFLRKWEPLPSAGLINRVQAILEAKQQGIKCWVSVEPVIYPHEALAIIQDIMKHIDYWKIGKINYHKYIEDREDWGAFLQETEKILKGKSYYIKKDLEAYRK